jgi:hypothetical protein
VFGIPELGLHQVVEVSASSVQPDSESVSDKIRIKNPACNHADQRLANWRNHLRYSSNVSNEL